MKPALAIALALLGIGCRDESASKGDAAASARVVGNCLAEPSLCPSRYCLTQRDGTFLCACADVPDGQACEPCPPGHRFHGKYSSCEPTCEVVAPTCGAGRVCGDLFGVATCVPASDAGR